MKLNQYMVSSLKGLQLVVESENIKAYQFIQKLTTACSISVIGEIIN